LILIIYSDIQKLASGNTTKPLSHLLQIMRLLFLIMFIFLISCSSNKKVPKPLGTIYKIVTGDFR